MKKGIEISPFGSLLVYKKEYSLNDVRSIIQEKGLNGLRIFAQLKEQRLPDLDFLKEFTFLEALDITSVTDYNFDFLLNLERLKDLSINVIGQNAIDLSKQVNLKSISLKWRNGKILGIEKCNKITSMCLVDFWEDDFKQLNSLIKLKDLTVKTSSIKNLNYIESFTQLETLFLGNCKKLLVIDKLKTLKSMKFLSFVSCPNIKDYTPIGFLPHLENLQLLDCKGIKSISFVEYLHSLRKLSLLGNTDVLDGNLIPAEKVEELYYQHRKHYNIGIENPRFNKLVKRNIEFIKRTIN